MFDKSKAKEIETEGQGECPSGRGGERVIIIIIRPGLSAVKAARQQM